MATLASAGRTAACNAITALINGDFRVLTSGAAVLATISLNAGASGGFDTAATGVAAIDLSPALTTTATGTGTADNWQLRTNAAANVITGTFSEITIDNTSITSGQTVNITSLTVTVPAS